MARRPNYLAVATFAALLLARLSTAANLTTFTNQLTPLIFDGGVPNLEFIPSQVEATFDLDSDSTNILTITVYGNITGNLEHDTNLPPLSNDSYWNNETFTSGKIINRGPKTNTLTTFFAHYEVASYTVQTHPPMRFCDQLGNQSCPLAPAKDGTAPGNLPHFTVSQPMYSGYGLTTIQAILEVRAGDESNTTIANISIEATPYLGDTPANLLRYLPVAVLLLTFAATASAAFSPWGTFNIYHWSSNYGRDEDQLRLITPGFGDCLAYIQFIVFSGSLALAYPGFYQPAVSQVSWSTLQFNQSFYSPASAPATRSVVDGLYSLTRSDDTFGKYNGISLIRQLVGMKSDNDIWPGVMIWVLVVIAAVLLMIQVVYLVRLAYRYATRTQDEDRRARNWPFSVGNVIRIVFNYFLLPILAFSFYQIALVVRAQPKQGLVAAAVLTIVILLAFSGWLLYQILSTHPRSILFDDLPTLLLYGPLYNTYSDASAAFALIPMLVNLIRAIAIGAIQVSGIAQIVVLAIAEVIYIMALNAFRPFSSPTSMNIYHTLFSVVRLIILLLMVAFAHEVNAAFEVKVWIAYVIFLLHGLVLLFGFFLHSLQTLVEVVARALGAGGEGNSVQRGGLVKVFGVRQLSRRNPRARKVRGSMASEAAMLDHHTEIEAQSGMRSRSLSASSGFLLNGRAAGSGRQSLALDTFSQSGPHDASASSAGQSRGPATPSGAPSVLSYMPGSSQVGYDPANRRTSNMTIMTGVAGQKPAEPADPYYRPPRARRATNEALGSPLTHGRNSAASGDWAKRASGTLASASDDVDMTERADESGAPSPAYLGYNRARADSAAAEDPDAPKTDYATREVDYYYGVRGPALNDQPTRKLKTGPADPTGPVSSASSWFQRVFGGKTKDQHKGFEVVRGKGIKQGMPSAAPEDDEMPPREVREPYRDEPGTPVPATTAAPRKLDLEDEADAIGAGTRRIPGEEQRVASPLDELGITKAPDSAPILPDIDAGTSIHVPSRFNSQVSRPGNSVRYRDEEVPALPRDPPVRQPSGALTPGRSTALSTIAQSPSSSNSPSVPRNQPSDAYAGGLSRMPFGSLGSRYSENTRHSITQRSESVASAISNLTDENRRPSFQSPPSPIQAPVQLVDPDRVSARRESAGSIGYVNQHRASDNIVNPTSTAHLGGSTAELVDPGLDRGPNRTPVPEPDHHGAHINF